MRPRKNILLWSASEEQASELSFVLNTQSRFRVTQCTASDFPAALTAIGGLSLVILLDNGNRELTEKLARIARSVCHVMIVAKANGIPIDGAYATVVLPYGASNAELLERARILTARKRGPKPQRKPVQPVPAAQGPAEVA